jgi:cytochrome c553
MTTRLLIRTAMMLAATVTLAQSAELTPEARSTAARTAVGTCAGCHGAQGTSILPFRSRSRGDPDALAFMWGMAAALDDAQIDALAQYYSEKPARSGANGDPALQARGKAIYDHGLVSQQVPPCGACHGSNGAGREDIPRLAGQHPQYFMNQMRSFQSNLRRADPMQLFANALNNSDLEALAAYLQSM